MIDDTNDYLLIIFNGLDDMEEVLMENNNGILFNDGLNAIKNGSLDQKQFIWTNINTAKNSNDNLFKQDMIEYNIKPICKKSEMILHSAKLNNSGKHNGLGDGYDTQTDYEPRVTPTTLNSGKVLGKVTIRGLKERYECSMLRSSR